MLTVSRGSLATKGANSGGCNQRCLAEIGNRLSSTIADESCLTITADFSRHFLKVAEQGGSPFTGDRMMYVILTLPYMIRDIVVSE